MVVLPKIIDFINGNLENNNEFKVPLEIVLNDIKEAQTTINCEYVTTELFDAFYNDYIDFKHYINDILSTLNEINTISPKNQVLRLAENQTRKMKHRVLDNSMPRQEQQRFEQQTRRSSKTPKIAFPISSRRSTTTNSGREKQLSSTPRVNNCNLRQCHQEKTEHLQNRKIHSNTTAVAKIKSSTKKQYLCWNFKRP